MIEVVWSRITDCEGQIFRQLRGGEFTYQVKGNVIEFDRTSRSVSKSTFQEALKYVPIENTVPLQKLQAPSYLFAILMDNRIRKNDW
ncbi:MULTISPECIES: hypothetical protein [unclassified Brevibacillus]|uniref:hypothetical protein n=1 Tax=unclassified Brevibacillus TaxID=2684853 RepID=UPI0006F60826|nr:MULTISPECIES: hypothetical protein [unclassified Brevibacillus]NRR23335.1 hypothetical protein [Brevibacillus sp. MS2.2]RAT97012.1 hypothetical protein ASG16_015120 [Brevibacillus sp. Leaf182]